MNSLEIIENPFRPQLGRTRKLCIVTPIWKIELTPNELKNIIFSLNLNSEYDHYFVCPKNLNIEFYKNMFSNSYFVFYDDFYFENIKGYNVLLQSSFFYEKFHDYYFMLILQTDALLVKNVNSLVEYDFDYIGAPWENSLILPRYVFKNKIVTMFLKKIGLREKCYVGNGGLSIRKIGVFIKVCKKYDVINWLNEDMRFSLLGVKKIIEIPDLDFSKDIFFEKTNKCIGEFPDVYGYHAMEKYYPDLYSIFFFN